VLLTKFINLIPPPAASIDVTDRVVG